MQHKLTIFILILFLTGCGNGDEEENIISVISKNVNGSALVDGMENIPVEPDFDFVFSAALDQEKFKKAVSIRSQNEEEQLDISFSNASSKATIRPSLNYDTEYTIEVTTADIAANSGRLAAPLSIKFRTSKDEIVRSMAPCTSGNDCLEKIKLSTGTNSGDFNFYSNYPIFVQGAEWQNLKYAIIVVHGQNRDADNYFSYLTNVLNTMDLNDSTVLLAPWFKSRQEAVSDDLYWPTGWREGRESIDEVKISSFAAIDSLVKQLSDKDRFPMLNQILFTGHSSGALFTHVYAGANEMEQLYEENQFKYIVANSQYFYYPGNQRYDEGQKVFIEPDDCFGYNYWPMGFQNAPSYLNGVRKDEFNLNFIQREIIYLLGNGSGTDGALNTTDCAATLLGSSRYQRGENIFLYMNEYHNNDHSHSRTIVNGIGHDGENMYKSTEFRQLLKEITGG